VFGGIRHDQRQLCNEVLQVMDDIGGQAIEGFKLAGLAEGLRGFQLRQVAGGLAPRS